MLRLPQYEATTETADTLFPVTQDRDDASAEQAGDDALAEVFWAVARQLRERSQETLAPWDITPAHLRACARCGGTGRCGSPSSPTTCTSRPAPPPRWWTPWRPGTWSGGEPIRV